MIAATIDSSAAVARLGRIGEGVPPALGAITSTLAEQLQDRIQAGMPRRSGRLAASVAITLDTDAGGVVGAGVGSDLPYAGVIEYGFSGTENVREHLRMMSQAFGHPVATPHEVLVRSYSRRVDLPAQGVFSGPLAEMAGDIVQAYQEAVAAELGS
jgi:hypothetical protein